MWAKIMHLAQTHARDLVRLLPDGCGVYPKTRNVSDDPAHNGPTHNAPTVPHDEQDNLHNLSIPQDDAADLLEAAYEPVEAYAVTEKPQVIVPRLPQELIDYILDFLWDDLHAIEQCRLVNRACYSYIATFSGILRLSSAHAFSAFSKGSTPANLHGVHTVYIIESITPWLHRVPLQLGCVLADLDHLRIYNWFPARSPLHPAVLPAIAQLHALSTLVLQDCIFENGAQAQRLLGSFPGLRELALCGVYVPTHRASAGGAGQVAKPAPQLTTLYLGNSLKEKPSKEYVNVTRTLAGWLTRDERRLEGLQSLLIMITHELLQDGELACIGQLVEAVGPHVPELELDFVGVPSGPRDPHPAADWASLKLDSCVSVQKLWVVRSSPKLRELGLISPACRVRSLNLARRRVDYMPQVTDWAALAAVLGGSAFSKLQELVNTRAPQGPGESKALKMFVQRMRARGVQFVDRIEFPFLDDD